MHGEAPSWKVWTALGAVYVIWSTTFLGIKVTNETMPPMLAAAVRFIVAGALLYAVAIRFGYRVGDRPLHRHWREAAIVGGLLMVGGNGGIVLAERTIPSGWAGLAIGSVPLWIAAIDRFVLHRRQPRGVVVGLVVGFAGVALLVAGSAGGGTSTSGMLLAIAAAMSWATGSVYQRHASLPARPFVAAGMEMLLAGGMFVVAGAVRGELGSIDPASFSRASILALAYLIVAGSWIGFTAYLWLLRNARTSLVSTYAYVTPVGAVIVGALAIGEPITPRMVIAGALILAAVAGIVSSNRSETGQERRPKIETQV